MKLRILIVAVLAAQVSAHSEPVIAGCAPDCDFPPDGTVQAVCGQNFSAHFPPPSGVPTGN